MPETTKTQDHWSSERYQNAASFVPKLATKVTTWLDVQPDDKILDIGCGDGILTQELAQKLMGTGEIHGTDSSESMIETARTSHASSNARYSIMDATEITSHASCQSQGYDKVFSNAALHWILRGPETRKSFFVGAWNALRSGGVLCFEMGGMGNVAEMRAALLAACAKRIGIARAREADPWFFPDEAWMGAVLDEVGFRVEKMELEYRPTPATSGEQGGVEGWVRLMGKQFFDAIGPEGAVAREEAVQEVMETLETVCKSPSGAVLIGYVRLRVLARKP